MTLLIHKLDFPSVTLEVRCAINTANEKFLNQISSSFDFHFPFIGTVGSISGLSEGRSFTKAAAAQWSTESYLEGLDLIYEAIFNFSK